MGYPEKKAEPRKRTERMQKCFWIENQGIQIPMEPNFRLRSTTVHLILHILHWSFSWWITVKVLGTVNAHDLPISCQETRLRRQTVLWDSDWRLLEQFLRILSSHLCLVLFFLVALSHEPPGAQLSLEGGVCLNQGQTGHWWSPLSPLKSWTYRGGRLHYPQHTQPVGGGV